MEPNSPAHFVSRLDNSDASSRTEETAGKLLCRDLCRNRPIPARIACSRVVSLSIIQGGGNIEQTRMKTVPTIIWAS